MDAIADNLQRYESDSPDWGGFFGTDDYARKTRVEVSGSLGECFVSEEFGKMAKKEDVLKNEVNRCIAVYSALKNLTPQQATDERVWTYLTHFVFWDYARVRWMPFPKNKEKKIKSIESHFFLTGVRGMVRDNAISRLWWMARVCSRVENCPLEDALGALLYMEDVRKEVMERATFCRSKPILNALMKCMLQSHKGDKKLHQRGTFRELSKRLNRKGGRIVLDSLAQPQLDSLVGDIVKGIISK